MYKNSIVIKYVSYICVPNDETYLIIISSSSIWAEDGKAKIIRAEELFVQCATYYEELLVLHRTYMVRNSNENF